jgi:hypothetical protein
MHKLITLLLVVAAMSSCVSAQMLSYNPMSPGAVPQVAKFTVANSGANFLITNPDATTSTVAKAAALTQSVIVFALPANAVVESCELTTGTAFAGTTTLTATLGITGTLTACIAGAYDLNAAVGNTNTSLSLLTTPINSVAATNLILALTATVSNISALSAGSVTVRIKWYVKP